MPKLICLSALLGALAIVALSADAQLPPIQGAGVDRLFLYKSVIQELKVTEEQNSKIRYAMAVKGGKLKDAYDALKDVPAEERTETMQKLNKELTEVLLKEIHDVLSSEQAKRLKQIELQQSVPTTLADEEVQKSLKLDEPQIAKINSIKDESAKEIAQFQITQMKLKQNPLETQEKIVILQKDANDRAMQVLTDEQKMKWKELVGEPFELKLSAPKKK